MADNVPVTPGSGVNVAADEVTYSGDTTKVQLMRQVFVSGTEGSKTLTEVMQVEDAAAPANPVGEMLMARRRDTLSATEVSTDGDVIAVNATNEGEVYVHDLDANAKLQQLISYPSTVAVSRIASSAATVNETAAKTSSGGVTFISGYNGNASVRWIKLYDALTASVVVGTTVPLYVFALPPTTYFLYEFSTPLMFSSAITFAMVTGAADADATAVGAGDILNLQVGTI